MAFRSDLRRRLGRLRRRYGGPLAPRHRGRYDAVQLHADQIAERQHRSYLGGGDNAWDSRGRYQVALLESLGMTKDSTVLDVGCGPARAGVHLARFLEGGFYVGVDYNASLLEAAKFELNSAGLEDRAELHLISDFDFSPLSGPSPDFVIIFSVLNHCSRRLQARFFRNIPSVMHVDSVLVVSHFAQWADEIDQSTLKLVDVVAPEPGTDLDPGRWSWGKVQDVSPFLIFKHAHS